MLIRHDWLVWFGLGSSLLEQDVGLDALLRVLPALPLSPIFFILL